MNFVQQVDKRRICINSITNVKINSRQVQQAKPVICMGRNEYTTSPRFSRHKVLFKLLEREQINLTKFSTFLATNVFQLYQYPFFFHLSS